MRSDFQHPRRRLLLVGTGALPVLLVLALGIQAVRRERQLALHDARQAAADLAARGAEELRSKLLDLVLPSAADVTAFRIDPIRPEAEPCQAIARAHQEALAFFRPDDEDTFYPPTPVGPGDSPAGPQLDRDVVPDEARAAWDRAVRSHAGADGTVDQRVALWQAALAAGLGSPAEGLLRLHLATTLLDAGRTGEAAELFESVARARPPWPSETGLSTVFLALRGRVHAGEIDGSLAPPGQPLAWVHRLLHAACVEWRLPESVLAELRPEHRRWAEAWKKVAARHDRARAVLPSLLGQRDRVRSPVDRVVEWTQSTAGESAALLTSHPVGGGTWWLLRSAPALRDEVTRWLASLGVPDHLAPAVTLGQREILPAPAPVPWGGEGNADVVALRAMGSAGPLQLRFHLLGPELLERPIRQRTGRMAVLVAVAALATLAASLAILRTLARQQRLTELQADFVASVTHELRAPLAAVRLMAEELADAPGPDPSRRAEYHRLILRESRRLSFLIENVLRHSSLERGSRLLERTDADLREALLATRDCLQPTADEREVQLRLALPSEPVRACVDMAALQQVFVNLLDNALKHAPPRSSIEVVLEPRSEPRPCLVVSVTDQGPGIPADEQARIFDSFYRRGSEIRRETAGVGLGLALARRLVAAHGGSLHVRSEPGHGATFSVVLPLD